MQQVRYTMTVDSFRIVVDTLSAEPSVTINDVEHGEVVTVANVAMLKLLRRAIGEVIDASVGQKFIRPMSKEE